MKKLFKSILSFFISIFKRSKEEKIVKVEGIKEIRDYLPQGFLSSVLDQIIYNKCAFECEKEGWKVTSCYFAGATLCLDLKNKKYKVNNIITICSDNTFGLFNHSNTCKRSDLSQEEINKVNILRRKSNKKEHN